MTMGGFLCLGTPPGTTFSAFTPVSRPAEGDSFSIILPNLGTRGSFLLPSGLENILLTTSLLIVIPEVKAFSGMIFSTTALMDCLFFLLWLSQPSRASQAFVVASQGVCEMLDAVEAPCCQERSETGASEPPHTCRATCPLPRHSPTPTSRLTVVSELRFLYLRN